MNRDCPDCLKRYGFTIKSPHSHLMAEPKTFVNVITMDKLNEPQSLTEGTSVSTRASRFKNSRFDDLRYRYVQG